MKTCLNKKRVIHQIEAEIRNKKPRNCGTVVKRDDDHFHRHRKRFSV